jgi:Alginate lyase
MTRIQPTYSILLLVLLIAFGASATPNAQGQNNQRCFPETSFCIGGRIRQYWEQNGGLPVFGFPISPLQEQSIEGRPFQTQWFERNRLELHPENPRPYDVLLGRLGVDRLAQQGRDWAGFAKSAPQPNCRFFAETGQNVCGAILSSWRASGLEFDGRRGASEAENLALFGLPVSPPQTERIEGQEYIVQWFERARFELHPENQPPYNVLLGRLGAMPPVCGASAPAPQGMPCVGIWVASEELAWRPTAGPAWERLKTAADGELGKPNLADQDSLHDVRTLAVALVYARTGDPAYRAKAADAIMSAIGTEAGGRTLALGRNLIAYVVAADLIDLKRYDPARDQQFRVWLDGVRRVQMEALTLISTHELRPNNWGTLAGASRIAAALYLGDGNDLARAAQVFQGWLGDRSAYAGFIYQDDLSWQADPSAPVGINPAGASKDGRSIDGVLPDDMQRGCGLKWPPCPTGYPWEGLQGAVAQAELLHRAGYDAWNWSDQAIRRAAQFYLDLSQQHPEGEWWPTERKDDAWTVWVINRAYGTSFATAPLRPGKNMGWTDWTHARP